MNSQKKSYFLKTIYRPGEGEGLLACYSINRHTIPHLKFCDTEFIFIFFLLNTSMLPFSYWNRVKAWVHTWRNVLNILKQVKIKFLKSQMLRPDLIKKNYAWPLTYVWNGFYSFVIMGGRFLWYQNIAGPQRVKIIFFPEKSILQKQYVDAIRKLRPGATVFCLIDQFSAILSVISYRNLSIGTPCKCIYIYIYTIYIDRGRESVRGKKERNIQICLELWTSCCSLIHLS